MEMKEYTEHRSFCKGCKKYVLTNSVVEIPDKGCYGHTAIVGDFPDIRIDICGPVDREDVFIEKNNGVPKI